MTRRPAAGRALLAGSLILLVLIGLGLAVWQMQRRDWKHALIAAVETRATASPVPAPGPSRWPAITAASDAYRRVRVTGRLDHGAETLVQAVTDRGGGFWVMTPLRTRDFTVLVNRGFVPPALRDRSRRAADPAGEVTITGLLRISEPRGGFLRANDPATDRWYSRDVDAIAAHRRLGRTAPYFIDADASDARAGAPVGGLTVVRFSDNHLVYAITWLAMAAGCAWGAMLVLRQR